jgi:hypothetical protein
MSCLYFNATKKGQNALSGHKLARQTKTVSYKSVERHVVTTDRLAQACTRTMRPSLKQSEFCLLVCFNTACFLCRTNKTCPYR